MFVIIRKKYLNIFRYLQYINYLDVYLRCREIMLKCDFGSSIFGFRHLSILAAVFVNTSQERLEKTQKVMRHVYDAH